MPGMRIMLGSSVAAICLLSVSLQGAAGVLIVEKTTSSGTPSTNQIQIESSRMRAETVGPRGEKQIVVFDGTRQVLMLIDEQNKSYTELTKTEADDLGAEMAKAMEQIKKQLESLPPDQQKQLESMMQGRMGGAGGAARKTVYKRTGTDTVGKWPCTKYEGYDGETKTADLCTVDPKALGLTDADFAVTRQFVEFFRRVVPAMADQAFAIGTVEQQGFAGVPVRRTRTVLGRQTTTEITDVSRQTFPDASYAPPAGYQKRPFAAMGRAR